MDNLSTCMILLFFPRLNCHVKPSFEDMKMKRGRKKRVQGFYEHTLDKGSKTHSTVLTLGSCFALRFGGGEAVSVVVSSDVIVSVICLQNDNSPFHSIDSMFSLRNYK